MSWAAAAVGAIGGIANAVIGADAKRKAANQRLEAIRAMENIDPQKAAQLALEADQTRFREQLKLQREEDPTMAAVREKGAAGLLSSFDTPADKDAEALAKTMATEAGADQSSIEALKSKLIADARKDLEAGAELPPEFQAELLRSGFEQGAQAGFRPANTGGAARTARTLLGSGGLALKEQRRQSAVSSASAVADLNTARMNILSRVIPTLQSIGGEKQRRAGFAFALANDAVPEAGLSGAEVANVDLARIQQQNQKQSLIGNLNAEKTLGKGEMWSGILGSATLGASAALPQSMGGAGGKTSGILGAFI